MSVRVPEWHRPVALTVLGLATVLLSPSALRAQGAAPQGWIPQEILKAERFVRPPANVERIILAPRVDISFPNPSPDRQWFIRTVARERGDIKDYGKPHLNLAGLRIDTLANRARSVTTGGGSAFTLVNPVTGATRTIAAPAGAKVSGATWSPNGSQIAFLAHFNAATHVYVADAATGKATPVTRTPVLATYVTSLDWTADGRSVMTLLVPDGRGAAPTHGPNGIEDGPQVRLSEGRRLPQRVHFDLLEDVHDKDLVKHFVTGQLALVDVKSRAVRKVGTPALIESVDMSPDGAYFHVTRLVEPFSYLVPLSSVGRVQELWDVSGKVVAELGRTPLREGDEGGDDPGAFFGPAGQGAAADTGRRNLQWHPAGSGMIYLQSVFAAGGGNAGRGRQGGGPAGPPAGRGGASAPGARPQPTSVRVMHWVPPYGAADAKVLYEGSGRLTSASFSGDGRTMFVSDSGTVLAIRTSEPGKVFNLGRGVTVAAGGGRGGGGFTRRGQGGNSMGRGGGAADSTALGGALATKRGPNGAPVVIVGSDNKTVFLSGTRQPGPNWQTQAPRPWVDRLDFESGQRTRIFDSPADAYEQFVTALDDDYTQFIYTRESRTVIADAYLRDARAGASRKLTSNVDVGPEVTGAQVKMLRVTRPRDGLNFWVEVTLPPDWRPGTRLPGVIWFYPREFSSPEEYDRVQWATNINRFPEIPTARPASTMQLWVAHGYALIEPDAPIMGPTGRMNDNYTQDLRETLDAVVNAVVDSGIVDRNRIGLGGHSYGAFSTVNAMTMLPYFKAGIAGDGMYNRTLTPFGFQSERRTFFEAKEMYLDMSPFLRADKLSGALLLYHALDDQNVGTHPISSIRMFQALQGLGKTAALYLYPYEDHSVATYESDLDLWARWLAWFDVHVKHAKVEPKAIQP